MIRGARRAVALCFGVALAGASCGGTLDAGGDHPHGSLPVDERNPVILYNDSPTDNWFGEYALLLANGGGRPLAGLIVTSSRYWVDLNTNVTGWTDLLAAARMSGLKDLPPITRSAAATLLRPANGQIDSTASNGSAGAQLIVDVSRRLSRPSRPVLVVSGTRLTDVADAYLLDHTVVERVVVVASLGLYSAPNALMGQPNGELDPWSDWIVAQRFQYIEANGYYDQTGDVTSADVPSLPQNPFGTWISHKLSGLYMTPLASDQVSVLSVGLPTFVRAVHRASPDTSGGFDAMQGLPLVPNENGNVWVITSVAAPLAASRFWDLLLGPRTFAP